MRLSRPQLLALGVAACGLAIGVALALLGVRMMPSYLAAWLFLLALPVGALPLVMALELAGAAAAPVMPPLRRMLVLLPVAALFAAPVLLRLGPLYAWSETPPRGFAGMWFMPHFFIGRSVAFLLIWVWLGLLFLRPPPARVADGRRGWATLGLLLHLVVGTLAATDWAMSIEPGLNSSAFGLLLIVAQSGIAVSGAILLFGGGAATRLGTLLVMLVGAWVFLHFIQFLVVWSADKPREVTWYLHRSHGLGAAAEWLGLIAFAAALLLLPRRLARRAGLVAAAAALVLLTHLIEMLWLVTPSFRGHFGISAADVLAMIGAVAVAATVLRAYEPRAPSEGAGYGPA